MNVIKFIESLNEEEYRELEQFFGSAKEKEKTSLKSFRDRYERALSKAIIRALDQYDTHTPIESIEKKDFMRPKAVGKDSYETFDQFRKDFLELTKKDSSNGED